MLVAGDIGGTKTDLAIFSTEAGPHAPLAQTKVHSADYPSLQAIVKEFLEKANKPVDQACFAVAGPLIGGRVKTTNLPWVIEENALAQELNLNLQSVHLINDLEAIARAIPILRPSDVTTINSGEPVPKGAIAVIAPASCGPLRLIPPGKLRPRLRCCGRLRSMKRRQEDAFDAARQETGAGARSA